MAPTCFGPFGPSSGSIRRNLAKVSLFKIISYNTSLKLLKLLLCSGDASQFVVCALGAVRRVLIKGAFVGRIILYLSKFTVKQQLKLVLSVYSRLHVSALRVIISPFINFAVHNFFCTKEFVEGLTMARNYSRNMWP